MATKHMVAVCRLINPEFKIEAYPHPIKSKIALPLGGLGVLLVFESKQAAYAWYGKKVETIRLEFSKQKD